MEVETGILWKKMVNEVLGQNRLNESFSLEGILLGVSQVQDKRNLFCFFCLFNLI